MAETIDFDCPSCGAALKPQGNAAQIKCDYCGSSVIVPENLRDSTIVVSPEAARWGKYVVWGLIAFIVVTFVLPFACSICATLVGLAGAFVPFFVK